MSFSCSLSNLNVLLICIHLCQHSASCLALIRVRPPSSSLSTWFCFSTALSSFLLWLIPFSLSSSSVVPVFCSLFFFLLCLYSFFICLPHYVSVYFNFTMTALISLFVPLFFTYYSTFPMIRLDFYPGCTPFTLPPLAPFLLSLLHPFMFLSSNPV